MNNSRDVSFVIVVLLFLNPVLAQEKMLKIDSEASIVNWKGYKPTGSHTGTLVFESGKLTIIDNKVSGGSFVVDMSSISDDDGSKKLVKHLKSKDFFEIEAYPTSKFEITKIEDIDSKVNVTGNITIKNITKEITFLAMITEDDNHFTFTSETFQINRTDFNVKYKSKSFFNNLKEKFINDEFDLQVVIVAEK